MLRSEGHSPVLLLLRALNDFYHLALLLIPRVTVLYTNTIVFASATYP